MWLPWNDLRISSYRQTLCGPSYPLIFKALLPFNLKSYHLSSRYEGSELRHRINFSAKVCFKCHSSFVTPTYLWIDEVKI